MSMFRIKISEDATVLLFTHSVACSDLTQFTAKYVSGGGQHLQREARGRGPRPGLSVTDVCCTGQNEPWRPDYGGPSVREDQSAAYPLLPGGVGDGRMPRLGASGAWA